MKKCQTIFLYLITVIIFFLLPKISFAQLNYKAFIVEKVIGYDKILVSDGYSRYIVDYNFECTSFDFYFGQTIYIDTYYSPGFYNTILVDGPLGSETCKVSSSQEVNLKRYFVDAVIDSRDEIIVEDSYGEKYIVEYGIGCLSMWRYEGKYVEIDIGGAFLDGIGDTIYLFDSSDECRVWDAQEIGGIAAPIVPYEPLPKFEGQLIVTLTPTPTSTPTPQPTKIPTPTPTRTPTPTPTSVNVKGTKSDVLRGQDTVAQKGSEPLSTIEKTLVYGVLLTIVALPTYVLLRIIKKAD